MDASITADLKNKLGISYGQAVPVQGGYLNEKWKIDSNQGDLLIKKFSSQRYGPERRKAVETALRRQIRLREMGVPCPFIRVYKENAIQIAEDGTAYMVMEYKRGVLRDSTSVSVPQMFRLGRACGQMHAAFSRIPSEGMAFDGKMSVDALWENYNIRLEEACSGGCAEYLEAVKRQRPILEGLDNCFFDGLPQGIAHRDFAADNVLFDGDEVSAIIDFDTNAYGYIWRDTGRALASFALESNGLNRERIQAFADGYSQYLPFSFSDAIKSLRLTWCMEAPWWIQRDCFEEKRDKVVRFRKELVWLTRHWFELESIGDGSHPYFPGTD